LFTVHCVHKIVTVQVKRDTRLNWEKGKEEQEMIGYGEMCNGQRRRNNKLRREWKWGRKREMEEKTNRGWVPNEYFKYPFDYKQQNLQSKEEANVTSTMIMAQRVHLQDVDTRM
jgi:hypothetical protein